jgi:Sensors of blue-light using FAD
VLQLIYTSREFRPLQAADLKRIVTRSRIRNAEDHITGFLYYSNGTFLQLLEGDADKVEATFERIADDFRHIHPKVIYRNTEATTRMFKDWSMEVNDPNATSAIMRQFFQADKDLDLTKLDAEKALLLLEAFGGLHTSLRL